MAFKPCHAWFLLLLLFIIICDNPHSWMFQGSSTMHQLLVTPLLLQNSSQYKKPLKRESHSFDNLNTSGSDIYAGVHKPPSYHRRSNPNILDLLPPPPIYAPPSLPMHRIYSPPTHGSGNHYYPPTHQSTSAPQSHSAFNRRHIKIYDCWWLWQSHNFW